MFLLFLVGEIETKMCFWAFLSFRVPIPSYSNHPYHTVDNVYTYREIAGLAQSYPPVWCLFMFVFYPGVVFRLNH